jgi:hypothetical protein
MLFPTLKVVLEGRGSLSTPVFYSYKQKQQTQKKISYANFFRLIETDAKSLNSLSCQGSGHSRRSSETSQISITSGSMMSDQFQENAEEDLWVLWGKIINEWETWSKKKQPQLKVRMY